MYSFAPTLHRISHKSFNAWYIICTYNIHDIYTNRRTHITQSLYMNNTLPETKSSHQQKIDSLFQTRRNSELGIPIIDSGAKKMLFSFRGSGMVVIPSSLSRCVGQKKTHRECSPFIFASETLHLLPRQERATSVTVMFRKIPWRMMNPCKNGIFFNLHERSWFPRNYGAVVGVNIYTSPMENFGHILSRWCFF